MSTATTLKRVSSVCRKGCGFEKGTYDCVESHRGKIVMQPRGRHALSMSKEHWTHAVALVPAQMYKQAYQGR